MVLEYKSSRIKNLWSIRATIVKINSKVEGSYKDQITSIKAILKIIKWMVRVFKERTNFSMRVNSKMVKSLDLEY